jgi:hypothetical protein
MTGWDNIWALSKVNQMVKCTVPCSGFPCGLSGTVIRPSSEGGVMGVIIRWDDDTEQWVDRVEYEQFLTEI